MQERDPTASSESDCKAVDVLCFQTLHEQNGLSVATGLTLS